MTAVECENEPTQISIEYKQIHKFYPGNADVRRRICPNEGLTVPARGDRRLEAESACHPRSGPLTYHRFTGDVCRGPDQCASDDREYERA